MKKMLKKKKNNNTWIDTSVLDLQVHTSIYNYMYSDVR